MDEFGIFKKSGNRNLFIINEFNGGRFRDELGY